MHWSTAIAFIARVSRCFGRTYSTNPWWCLATMMAVSLHEAKKPRPWGFPWGRRIMCIKKVIRHHNVAIFSANFPLYADFSSRVMAILNRFSDAVDIYSIDEAFIQLGGLTDDPIGYATTIRSTF